MTLSNEIKSLVELQGRKKKELQAILNLARPQALTTKLARNSWSAEDLTKVVSFLGGELVIKIGDREIKITEEHFNC